MELGNIREHDPRTLYVIAEEVVAMFAVEESIRSLSNVGNLGKNKLAVANGNSTVFDAAIKSAAEIRAAGLTPLYLADEAGTKLFVTSRELLSSRMH